MTVPINTWDHKLQLGDVFHDDARTFEQRRDEIVRRIKAASFYDEEHDGEIVDIVDELSGVRTVDEFDAVWDYFYDWADFNRVWVETHGPLSQQRGGLR